MRSQSDIAYEQIKDLILDLELCPGELVTEKGLMELTGCGRTPVREAMQRLQRDGLLQVVPFRGAFVTEISAKDVTEIAQVREMLESFAAALAARLATSRQIERILAVLRDLEPVEERTPRELFEADRAFHTLVVEASGHKRIRDIIATLSDQIQRLRYLSATEPERAQQAHAEHCAIADALALRDGVAAETAMRLHLHRAHRHLSQIVHYQTLNPLTGRNEEKEFA